MKKDQPHDKFFKQAFSYRQVALDYFKNFVSPKLIKQFDLRTLHMTSDSYIDDDMGEYFSDMVFSIDWKKEIKKKNMPRVYLLVEHKSYVPKFIHVQLLKYMVEVWMQDIKDKKPLTLILPIVIYHGKRKWKYQSFTDFFKLPDDDFKSFIPKFDYLLTDLNKFTDEELLMLNAGFLVNTLIALKHSGDEEYLKEFVERIFYRGEKYIETEVGENFIKKMNVYLSRTTDLSEKEVFKIFELLPSPLKELGMTTYDRFVKKGEDKAKAIALKERQRILEENEKKIKETIKRFINKFPEMTAKEVAEVFDVNLDVVNEVMNLGKE